MYEEEYLHKTIPSMATAYAYHICQNYAVLEGNKRIAIAAALVFLELNACRFSPPEENLYITMMEVAKGELNKESLPGFFERYAENKQM